MIVPFFSSLLFPTICAFTVMPSYSRLFPRATSILWISPSSIPSTTGAASDNPMNLTPQLLQLANSFESINDDKLRYKQLLYMATKLPRLDPSKNVPENKVPGCLSTVYIDAKAVEKDGKILIEFEGDSDGLLTKGLVALLIRGLSGNTSTDIERVDPGFIKKAGIAASLTPGRNNGFLNMLAVMKNKAKKAHEQHQATSDSRVRLSFSDGDSDQRDDRPMYNAIVSALQALKPEFLDLVDVSYRHAGHVEGGNGVESHFELQIVAGAFEGLNLVKRHKLIYMVLGELMPKIHALQISAKTPEESK